MASAYGENHGLVCACGLRYDQMHTGLSFRQVRNDIISVGVDARTGRTKYGRRHGVLGTWFQYKQSMWKSHVAACEDALRERRAG